MNKLPISLCMIVKNEEKYIEKCLKSIMNVTEEIIIVDTGSTDSTIEIARQYTDLIYDYEWTNDFSAARNFSISKAKSEYILILDADEFVDPQSYITESLVKDYYMVTIKNHLDYGYAMNHSAIRLFRNDMRFKFKNRVHEHLNINDFSNLTCGYLELLIHHVGYQKEVISGKNKDERNLKLLLEEVKVNPSEYTYFNLGSHYQKFGNYLEAVEAYRNSFQLGQGYSFTPKLILGIAECLIELDREWEAFEILKNSIDAYPEYTDLYFLMGSIYENNDYLNDAQECYQKCLELGEAKKEFSASYDGVGSYLSLSRLSNVFFLKGNRTEAVETLSRAVVINKFQIHNVVRFLEYNLSLHESELSSFLERLYPMNEEESINTLLKVLYSMRSPLLKYFVDKYVAKTDILVTLICKQYSGDYNGARSYWMQMDSNSFDGSNMKDLILLCVLLGDFDLYYKFSKNMNLSKREGEFIELLIARHDLKSTVNADVIEDIYLYMTRKVISLKEFDVFEYLFNQVFSFNKDIQLKLAKMLHYLGFYGVSRELLIQILERTNRKDWSIERYVGDLWMAEGYYQEALQTYESVLKQCNDYPTMEKVYNLYKLLDDQDGCRRLLNDMLTSENNSLWLKTIQ